MRGISSISNRVLEAVEDGRTSNDKAEYCRVGRAYRRTSSRRAQLRMTVVAVAAGIAVDDDELLRRCERCLGFFCFVNHPAAARDGAGEYVSSSASQEQRTESHIMQLPVESH